MQIFKKQTEFNFMGQRKIAVIFSAILIIVSLASIITKGLNFGLDFTGGTLIEVSYSESADLANVRSALETGGYGNAIVQHFGSTKDVVVRIPADDKASGCGSVVRDGNNNVTKSDNKTKDLTALGDKVLSVLKASDSSVIMRRQECVGAQVGDELRDDGGLAMLIALACILIYVLIRFEYKFAFGAVAALIHDVIITLGFFSILQLNFDLTVLAAVLAVIGYSLNDTIVVFDRIRENFRIIRKGSSVEVFNISLNQTLSRTLMTSITTLLVLIAMFFLGGEIIHAFATALIVGVVIGTYSSIYVASTTVVALGITRENLMEVVKEGAEQANQENFIE
ncbi:Protein translocase subunit SecF [hydrothermal vent metagenome]|uniref:Protein translocase subunit SecF n=1 Tax=hydrothermal vent metagenome TaxID=652676 RepID=A0A3B1AG27_9ZZZZ